MQAPDFLHPSRLLERLGGTVALSCARRAHCPESGVSTRPSIARLPGFALLVSLGLSGGCGRPPVPGDGRPSDGGAAGARIELGTGQNQFVPLKDGDAVAIVKGPQGGYHIWGSIRSFRMDPKNIEIEYWVDLPGPPVENVSHSKYRLSLLPQGDYSEWFGMTLFILDPDKINGKTVAVRFEAKDASGQRAQDSRQVAARLP